MPGGQSSAWSAPARAAGRCTAAQRCELPRQPTPSSGAPSHEASSEQTHLPNRENNILSSRDFAQLDSAAGSLDGGPCAAFSQNAEGALHRQVHHGGAAPVSGQAAAIKHVSALMRLASVASGSSRLAGAPPPRAP